MNAFKCVASLQHLLDLLFCYFSDYNSLKAENILENNQLVSHPLVIKDIFVWREKILCEACKILVHFLSSIH